MKKVFLILGLLLMCFAGGKVVLAQDDIKPTDPPPPQDFVLNEYHEPIFNNPEGIKEPVPEPNNLNEPLREKIIENRFPEPVNNQGKPEPAVQEPIPIIELWHRVLRQAFEKGFIDQKQFDKFMELDIMRLPEDAMGNFERMIREVMADGEVNPEEYKHIEDSMGNFIERLKEKINEFTNEPMPEEQAEEDFWHDINWEMWGVLLALLVAVAGYLFSRRKQKSVSKYFNDIDNTYSNFKMKSRRCEAELFRLKDIVTEEFKSGKIDESSFSLLDRRIDDYLKEVREQIINEKFGGMPANLKNELSSMLSSGDISKEEHEKFAKLIDSSTMRETDKKELGDLIKKWEKEDKT